MRERWNLDKNDIEKMITALGAMAELLGVFKKELMNNGFDDGESLALCIEWMRNAQNG